MKSGANRGESPNSEGAMVPMPLVLSNGNATELDEKNPRCTTVKYGRRRQKN